MRRLFCTAFAQTCSYKYCNSRPTTKGPPAPAPRAGNQTFRQKAAEMCDGPKNTAPKMKSSKINLR